MKETKRYVWLDIVKIIACFFVIINHAHAQVFLVVRETAANVIFDSFCFSICKSAVPLFVMTSGYLLLQKESDYRKAMLRIARVGVPLIVLSVYYYFWSDNTDRSILGFISHFFREPISIYLWYLYMVIGLYLVTPFLSKTIKALKMSDMMIFVIAFLIIPSMTDLLTTYFGYNLSSHFFNAFFPKAIACYVAGVVLARLPLKKELVLGTAAVYTVSIGLMMLSVCVRFFETGERVYDFDSWLSFPVIMSSLSLFYIIRYFFENRKYGEKTTKVISTIGSVTFGVYLIHYFVLGKLFSLGFVRAMYSFNSYIAVVFVEVFCFALCGLAIFAAKKIPYVKWFL